MERLIAISGRHADFIILLSLTLIAAVPRLWALGDIPQGIHGDEAQVGLDARRVLAEGWIGPYTRSALGQPSGHAYLTAPAIELFGSTAWSVRLPLALVGVAAVPLTYTLFRLQSTRTVATIAALLLAVSLWHIHFSRVAHWPISYGTVALAVLVLWTLGLQREKWYWLAAAGLMLGLGLYTYNIYPIFVIAFALWVAVYTLVFKRGPRLLPWTRNIVFAAVASVIVGLPLFVYIANPKNDYFGHYRGYYEQYSLLKSPSYEAADFQGRVDLIAKQMRRFVGAYVWEGVTDYVDAASPDRRPMLGWPMTVLALAGACYAARRWRETPHLMSLMIVAVIPLTTVLQTNAIYRGPLGAAPFVSFLAAVPLGLAWDGAWPLSRAYRAAVWGGIAAVLLFIAYSNLNAYFGSWAKSDVFPTIYARPLSEASEHLESLPDRPYVYFLSACCTFNHETRQYLAPGYAGEDRSTQFGRRQDLEVDRSRYVVFVLLPGYLDQLTEIEQRYPGGRTVIERRGATTLYIAYHLPAVVDVPR